MKSEAYPLSKIENCFPFFEQIKYRTIKTASQNFLGETRDVLGVMKAFPSEFWIEKDKELGISSGMRFTQLASVFIESSIHTELSCSQQESRNPGRVDPALAHIPHPEKKSTFEKYSNI